MIKNKYQLISWLLEGDVSIQYQTQRDLLGDEHAQLQERIAAEGWGAQFLSMRQAEGHWGQRFYQPKWISSHYTLLDLRNLNISPDAQEIQQSLSQIFQTHKGADGGILCRVGAEKSDICVNGMFLNYASYFGVKEEHLKSIVDYLLIEQMSDGGFNCNSNGIGAVHSSVHTTLSVLEGILEYKNNGHRYRLEELQAAGKQSREFLLEHRLFRSHRTGEIIDKKMLMLSYPSRWKYDILRALDYFQYAGIGYDPRMQDALDILKKKRRKDGGWALSRQNMLGKPILIWRKLGNRVDGTL